MSSSAQDAACFVNGLFVFTPSGAQAVVALSAAKALDQIYKKSKTQDAKTKSTAIKDVKKLIANAGCLDAFPSPLLKKLSDC